MKIGQLPDIPVPANPPAAKKPEQGAVPAAQANASAPATAGVAVTVSKLARALVQNTPAADPDIDAEKVAQVKAAIDQGTFKVNPQVIADKLLSNAQDMLNRARR